MSTQLDREGVEETNKTQFDLLEHFTKNGLSENALNKIKQDILSGDMKVDLLCECDYDEVVEMCKDYNFNVLQRKSFIKCVKLFITIILKLCQISFQNTKINVKKLI